MDGPRLATATQVALNRSDDRRSSGEVVSHLKSVELQGLSGRVGMTETGDREMVGMRFRLLNFVHSAIDGTAEIRPVLDFIPREPGASIVRIMVQRRVGACTHSLTRCPSTKTPVS